MRAAQVAADPAAAGWVTGVLWDRDRRLAVGRAGFHGPPDARGMVEVGSAVVGEQVDEVDGLEVVHELGL
jgi:hypothetical protein